MKASFSGFKLKENIMVISGISYTNHYKKVPTKRCLNPFFFNKADTLPSSLTNFISLLPTHIPIRPPLSKSPNHFILLHLPFFRVVKCVFDLWVCILFIPPLFPTREANSGGGGSFSGDVKGGFMCKGSIFLVALYIVLPFSTSWYLFLSSSFSFSLANHVVAVLRRVTRRPTTADDGQPLLPPFLHL